MSLIDDVRREREDLARVLKKHRGIRRIVEDLYPDSAHFIYELLQNAEDTGATEASFVLNQERLLFEHNGRSFEADDVYAITDIGEGTKAGADDKIGCFGVGFKAVFAYSESPHIWSPTYSFKITDLVLPTELNPRADLCGKTHFEFPFDNPKKSKDVAFEEIACGFDELAETTLLFLSQLKSISWEVGDRSGQVVRAKHSDFHVEVHKKEGSKIVSRSHFLKFERPVIGLEDKQCVAAAFALDLLPNVESFEPITPLSKQVKITSGNPGQVAVFFPAEKEVSGLRFHVHAPFVPELSRASIKETPANDTLFEQLAGLVAASLHQIRDLGLLTVDFLEVLPNARDDLGDRYEVIRTAVVDQMNDHPLTPTYSKSHAPAKDLVQGRAALKSLLSEKDIELLMDYGEIPPRWAVGASQKNSNADRFLESLKIGKWDADDFVKLLRNKTRPGYDRDPPANISSEDVQQWLASKSVEWHQELYALLLTDHLALQNYGRKGCAESLGELRIVRLADGSSGVASESFFATEGVAQEQSLAIVDEKTYASGRSKAQKENAKALLEEIGVREIGEAELVENILKQRYTYDAEIPDDKTYRRDLKRFIALVEQEPSKAALFAGYFVLEGAENWRTPDEIYLDQPFVDSGLAAYYLPLGEDANRAALHDKYADCGISTKRLISFARAIGATDRLAIHNASCLANPKSWELVYSASGNRTSYCIDDDYQIPGIAELLATESIALSKLIWKTASEQENNSWLTASFRNNSSYAMRTAPSQLAAVLKECAWIPQTDGRFVRPAEADHDLLPSGFPYDPGWKWLAGIGFGQQLAERSEAEQQRREMAKGLGFNDDETLQRAKRFAALPPDEQCRILEEQESRVELPDHAPSDPKRRAERVAVQALKAPARTSEERKRAVSVNRDTVKQEASEYLRQQYTNSDGEMICQICKGRLPFELDDGTGYFERVEILPDLSRHHKENYAALCPNHAAMFQHANNTEQLIELISSAHQNTVPVVLGKKEMSIYFTRTHLADLKVVIKTDSQTLPAGDSNGPDAQLSSGGGSHAQVMTQE